MSSDMSGLQEPTTSPVGPKNYASASLGATVHSNTGEAGALPSTGESVLLDSVDDVWVAPAAPQSLVIKLAPHPPIRYVGWHVFHDYLTNPKQCVVLSGMVPSCLSETLTCTALPGSGVQIWELPTPIPENHMYLSFQVLSTFGGNNTYINRLYAFAEHPGASFAPKNSHLHAATHQSSAHHNTTADEVQISSLLKDLDSDIRLLHPLRLKSPQRMRSVADYAADVSAAMQEPPELTSTLAPPPRAHGVHTSHHAGSSHAFHHHTETGTPPRPSTSPRPSHYDPASYRAQPHPSTASASPPRRHAPPTHTANSSTFGVGSAADTAASLRLQTLERSVMALVSNMEDQRKDLGSIKHLLARHDANTTSTMHHQHHTTTNVTTTDRERVRSPQRSSSAVNRSLSTPFPDGALRSYVERILDERLAKYSRRTEQAITARVDDHMQRILREVSVVVDERVRRHVRDLSYTPSRSASTAERHKVYAARSRSPSSYYTRVDPLSAPKRSEPRAPHATSRDGRDTLY